MGTRIFRPHSTWALSDGRAGSGAPIEPRELIAQLG